MLAGVILAGGQSSRMGTDKSLLTLPDSQLSLLEHGQKQLALICDNNVFISGDYKHGIADVIPHCGPLSGIHAVITYLGIHHPNISELLVVAVDMPDVSPEDYNHLIKIGRKNFSLCSFENCFLPLYIPLSDEVTGYLATLLKPQANDALIQSKKRQYSVKKMLELFQGLQIPPLRDTQLANINTSVQWQQRCAEQSILRQSHDRK